MLYIGYFQRKTLFSLGPLFSLEYEESVPQIFSFAHFTAIYTLKQLRKTRTTRSVENKICTN